MLYKQFNIRHQVIAALIMLLLPFMMLASEDVPPPPDEALAFVPTDYKVIDYVIGDLDGDGRKDAILLLQKPESFGLYYDEFSGGQRPLLILQRQANNKLKLAVRSEYAMRCEKCAGMHPDPYEGIELHRKGFTIVISGGPRWEENFRFEYSRRDQTWQLIAVDTLGISPEETEENHYRSPRDFGLINLADFDVDHWKGRGAR
jgi:hypothetical protein